jgi:hypothetical protein
MEYRARPYLADATSAEIAERLRDIIVNLTTLTPEGQIGVLPPLPHGDAWYRLLEHVLEAYRARGETPPNGFLEGSKLPQPSYPEAPRAIVGFGKLNMPSSGNYIVKLGQARHIETLFREGKLRINPASTYNDPSLNSAIRDDELSLHAFGVKAEVKMTAYDGKTGAKKGDFTPAGNLLYRTELQFDYYVFCYSRSFEPRLFWIRCLCHH